MSDTKKVRDIRINGEITKTTLIELGSDPELEEYIIICRWKGERYSCGWSNMDNRELAYGSAFLTNEIQKDLFELEP